MIYSLIHFANSEQKKIISAALIGLWAYLRTTYVCWSRVGTGLELNQGWPTLVLESHIPEEFFFLFKCV